MNSFYRRQVCARLSILMVCMFGASLAEAEATPEEVVASYFREFSAGVDAGQLVADYWLPHLITFSPGGHPARLSASEWTGVLDDFREQVLESGWLRTTIVESAQCLLREDVAIVNIRYLREFEGGTSAMEAVLYTLIREDGWKLSSVMPTNPDLIVTCAASGQ